MAKLLGTDDAPPVADARPPISMGTPIAALLAVAILAATVMLSPGPATGRGMGRGVRGSRYRANASKARYAWSYVEPFEAKWAQDEAEAQNLTWPELPSEVTLRQIVAFVKQTGVTVMGYDQKTTFFVESDGLYGDEVVVRREARKHARAAKVAVHSARRR